MEREACTVRPPEWERGDRQTVGATRRGPQGSRAVSPHGMRKRGRTSAVHERAGRVSSLGMCFTKPVSRSVRVVSWIASVPDEIAAFEMDSREARSTGDELAGPDHDLRESTREAHSRHHELAGLTLGLREAVREARSAADERPGLERSPREPLHEARSAIPELAGPGRCLRGRRRSVRDAVHVQAAPVRARRGRVEVARNVPFEARPAGPDARQRRPVGEARRGDQRDAVDTPGSVSASAARGDAERELRPSRGDRGRSRGPRPSMTPRP
jgi:hypothetical protein